MTYSPQLMDSFGTIGGRRLYASISAGQSVEHGLKGEGMIQLASSFYINRHEPLCAGFD